MTKCGFARIVVLVSNRADRIGPGGWKCPCCGPTPKDRQKWRRRVRRIIRQADRKNHSEGTEL